MLSKQHLTDLLNNWHQRGWLRALDIAFADFLAQQDQNAHPAVLLAAALISHQLGRGHICLDLAYCLDKPGIALDLPPDGDAGYSADELPRHLLAQWTLDDWLDLLRQSPLILENHSPLALDGSKLYLRRYWQYERDVVLAINQRLQQNTPLPEDLAGHLMVLFPHVTAQQTDWQKCACALAARSAFSIITGGPGTGKTWTLVRLLALLQALSPDKLRICLAAPTGKAAARMTEAIRHALPDLPENYRTDLPDQAVTLHRLLGARPDSRLFKHHAGNPLHADIVIIDEASMIDLEMMALLLTALKPQTRLILLGDKDQLASVEAGSVFGDICHVAENKDFSPETASWLNQVASACLPVSNQRPNPLAEQIIKLQTSRRFHAGSGIGCLARAVNNGDADAISAIWQDHSFTDLSQYRLQNAGDRQLDALTLTGIKPGVYGYQYYLEVMANLRPAFTENLDAFYQWAQQVLTAFDQFRLLCALRNGEWGVTGLNQRIANELTRSGLINNTKEWYEGRPVMITRNDYHLGLMNGDIGIALKLPQQDTNDALRVVFPDADGIKSVLPSRLTHYQGAYAMTVHKSQGSEFNHVALVLPERMNPVLTRELIYTGITRAKSHFSMLCTDESLLRQAINNPVFRAGGLRELARFEG